MHFPVVGDEIDFEIAFESLVPLESEMVRTVQGMFSVNWPGIVT
jgi:hypothetical protein